MDGAEWVVQFKSISPLPMAVAVNPSGADGGLTVTSCSALALPAGSKAPMGLTPTARAVTVAVTVSTPLERVAVGVETVIRLVL